MPCLHQFSFMLLDNSFNFIQFMPSETVVGCQFNWIKPKFCLVILSFDMNMRRFFTFVAKEEKTVTPHL